MKYFSIAERSNTFICNGDLTKLDEIQSTCKLTLIKCNNTHLYRPEKKKNSYKKEIFIGFDSAKLVSFCNMDLRRKISPYFF